MLDFLVVACLIVAIYGSFLMAFGKGRRMRGAALLALGFVAAMVLSSVSIDKDAQQAGWKSAAEQTEATEAGFSDPEKWREEREAFLAAQQAAEAEAAAEAERLAAEQEAARQEAGFHCLSDFNGRHFGFARLVKANLREPDSFEHIETRITPVNEDGEHQIIMIYRGRNGFGGMNVETISAVISNETCDLIEILPQ